MGTILLVLLVLIIAVIVFAATRPDEFSYQRSTTVNARADKVFPLINDLHQWAKWSPWEEKDPTMQKTYSGAEKGQGAAYQWSGNKDVGQGRIEFVEVFEPKFIHYQLEFIKPFKAVNQGKFLLEADGENTRVTWQMAGKNALPSKIMGLFINFEQMIGKDFELGLAKLKQHAES